MPHIDTLATARRLEQAGLPIEHARAVSEAISDAIRESLPDWSEFATKEFVRAEIQALKNELRTEFYTLLKDLELRIAVRLRSQMIWFYGFQVALVGAAAALFKLLTS